MKMKILILFILTTLYQTRRHNRKRIHKKNRHLNNNDYYYQYPNKNNLESFNPQAFQSKVASKQYFKDLVRHETIDNAVFNNQKNDLGASLDAISEKSKIPSVIIQTFLGKDYNTEQSLKQVIENNAKLNRDKLEELDFLKDDLLIVGKKVQIIQRKVNQFLNRFETLFEEAKQNKGQFNRFQYENVTEELKNLQKENRLRQEEQKIRNEEDIKD